MVSAGGLASKVTTRPVPAKINSSGPTAAENEKRLAVHDQLRRGSLFAEVRKQRLLHATDGSHADSHQSIDGGHGTNLSLRPCPFYRHL